MKYPDTNSTDPAVLESLVGVTPKRKRLVINDQTTTDDLPKSQPEREAVIQKEDFEEKLAEAVGMRSPADRIADAEHQLEVLANTNVSAQPASLQLVAIRSLKESPTNPRKRKGNIDELIASVRKLGILQPPVVRKVGGEDYESVVGHQRIRAAREIGLDEIMVDVRTLTDNEVLEIQAAEQLQRVDLHELEEAEHYGRMVKAGYAPETIAARIGKSSGHVVGRIKLLSLCPEGRSAFFDGAFHPSVGIPLARIYPSDVQAKALQGMRKIETARAQIEFLRKEFSQSLKGAPFDPKDETLVEAAGSCSVCPYNANNMAPTLFGDMDGGVDRQGLCLHTVCFGTKCRAQATKTIAKAKDAGASVLSAAEARTVLQPTGALQYKAEYVKADDIVQGDRTKRTWMQIFDKLEPEARPELTVAPDPAHPGKTIKLFDRKKAMKTAKDMGLSWAQSATSSKSPEEKAEGKAARDKAREASAKQEAVLAVTKLTIPRLAGVWSKRAGLPELRLIAAEAFARRKTFNPEDYEVCLSGFTVPGAKDGKVPTERAVEKWIDDGASANELIGLILILTKYEAWIDTDDDFETSFADLAAAAGANLKEGVRAQQLEASMAADKKAKK